VVESVVNRKLMLKLAAADGIKPSSELLIQAFDKYVNGLDPTKRAQFEQALKAQKSSIDAKRAEAAKDTSSQEAVAINKWIKEKVLLSLKVEDSEAEKFYKEHLDRFKKPATVKVAHILISPEKPSPEKMKSMTFEQKKAFAENADKKAKAKADKILAQVKAGADFAKLAKENSSCPSGKFSKGELPAFDKTGATNERRGGRMDPTFTVASFKLKPGEVSGLVRTPFGYHIIKDVERHDASTIPFDKVEKSIKDNLKQKQMAEKIKSLLEKARKDNKVEIFLKGPVATPQPVPPPTKSITL
ncbi:MAG: peptidylprolyl isomerase, partial [Victivallales bacterium]|nr:peptidylprolyl isomerase [Victivallales bacterium]